MNTALSAALLSSNLEFVPLTLSTMCSLKQGMTFLERVEGDLQRRQEASTYEGLDHANNSSGHMFGSYNFSS